MGRGLNGYGVKRAYVIRIVLEKTQNDEINASNVKSHFNLKN